MNPSTYDSFQQFVALPVRVVKPFAAHTRTHQDDHLLWPETGCATLYVDILASYLGALGATIW